MNKTKQKMYLDLGLTFVQALELTIDLYTNHILTDQEQEILAARLHSFTFRDLGKRYHITSARVKQIEQRILRKMENHEQLVKSLIIKGVFK